MELKNISGRNKKSSEFIGKKDSHTNKFLVTQNNAEISEDGEDVEVLEIGTSRKYVCNIC